MSIERASLRVVEAIACLRFGSPVTHVYSPLRYAWRSHQAYLRRYGKHRRKYLMLGMNPGPYGMVQTGVPFGEVSMVRDWLGINAQVGKPEIEHPKRPVTGFCCTRSEVSGKRLWGWAKGRFAAPEAFFKHFYVHNYCPLAFMDESGRNLTPDKLAKGERAPLFAGCDDLLRETVAWLRPEVVIGIGVFAQTRAKEVLRESDLLIAKIPHPSPANPSANRGWAERVDAELKRLGILN